jgi:dsDNA-specific endonuclease/ATPase MutS2
MPPEAPPWPEAQGPENSGRVSLPITGELDLHTFRPRDVQDVVREYIRECGRRGICRVRIVHGKGIGQLREIVHAELRRHPWVESFQLASSGLGGWGATLAQLRSAPAEPEADVGERVEGREPGS